LRNRKRSIIGVQGKRLGFLPHPCPSPSRNGRGVKPERLYFDVTEGKALGQNIETTSKILPGRQYQGRFFVLPSRQKKVLYPLIPGASPTGYSK
jgi:hypothetical protein